ncbi:MAG: HNH endonuclease [Chloroflexi bacterium]|nr:HNH endonuclease [Chloroflexota bacterium]
MTHNSIDRQCKSLILKCTECGIPPASFIREKILELEERKRILLTPSKYWFRDNYSRYNEFASLALQRPLSEEEKFDPLRSLIAFIKIRLNPEPRINLAGDFSLKRKMLEEYNGRCAICGESLTADTIILDHKIPSAEGGANHPLNIQPLCSLCNSGKSDYYEETIEAAARPWFEARKPLIEGRIFITPKKRFCVLVRDRNTCQNCGAKASETTLEVVCRVPIERGGQPVYDNLVTLCSSCFNEAHT